MVISHFEEDQLVSSAPGASWNDDGWPVTGDRWSTTAGLSLATRLLRLDSENLFVEATRRCAERVIRGWGSTSPPLDLLIEKRAIS
jgi:hypothetical protein